MNMLRAECEDDPAPCASPAGVEQWKGHWILSHPAAGREGLIRHAQAHWRSRGFPFQVTSREQTVLQAQRLARTIAGRSADMLLDSLDTAGLGLANSYHPQMWSIRAYGRKRSPIEYFEDDEFLARMLERAPRFWPNSCCWNASYVRSLFRIAAPGRVANFRPMVAAGVIRKFCPPGGQVVDFCSGYGGRLLAAIVCGVSYAGIDASAQQIAGSGRMADDLKDATTASVMLSQGSAIQELERIDANSADLVFTSPPYFDKERYGSDVLQSYIEFPTYRQWLDGFLRPAIRHSFRVLKRGGYLAINVSDNRRFPLAVDTNAILNDVFGNVKSYNMRMRRLPSYRHFDSAHRMEQILVSAKPRSGRHRRRPSMGLYK
jgi:SAM-dependent methyltransferase